MRHLIASYKNSSVFAFKDRAYLVADTTSEKTEFVELLGSNANKNNDSTDSKSTTDEESSSLSEICAVAVIGHDSILRCAVARNNKSLEIYSVESTSQTANPALVYRTPKRISCFAFSQLPTGPHQETAPVLLAGDVAGDSYAYNVLEKGHRLLLGHTASMLTNIAIVDNQPTLLLTSDRDEKIRVSRFPDAYVIDGFLLGHTAYVTGFTTIERKTSSGKGTLVVSCGGDESLRLWDLSTKDQLCNLSTRQYPTSTNKENAMNTDCDDDESKTKNDTKEIPTAIASSPCGQIAAVIFDCSKRLSFYKIGYHDSDPTLEFAGSMDCASQPLSVDIRKDSNGDRTLLTVLMKDPDYLAVYEIFPNSSNNNEIATPKTNALKALQQEASEKMIVMPETILEKDEFGNPVLQKENETRGPAGNNVPWNRVERVAKAKERGKRRKKKAKLAAAVENN